VGKTVDVDVVLMLMLMLMLMLYLVARSSWLLYADDIFAFCLEIYCMSGAFNCGYPRK